MPTRLTTAQLATLKADLEANTNTVQVITGFDANGEPIVAAVQIKDVVKNGANAVVVAGWYNVTRTPAYKVYRSFVPMSEVMGNNFDWTRVDNLSAGKSRIWEWMGGAYTSQGVQGLSPSKAQCRSGINTVWVGTAADLAVRAAVYTHCYRDCTRGERLFLNPAGTGNVPDASGDGPGTMEVEGNLLGQDIEAAWTV